MSVTKPMLSATATSADLDTLPYPMFLSYKMDGIRVIVHPQQGLLTRTMRPIPNALLQTYFAPYLNILEWCDGELLMDGGSFNDVQSLAMSHYSDRGINRIKLHVFDKIYMPELPYEVRNQRAEAAVCDAREVARHVPQYVVRDAEDVRACFEDAMASGYEGVMIRRMDSPYKFGRSTLKQGHLIKYKEFADAEGKIIDMEPLFTNTNEIMQDPRGENYRPTRIDGLTEQPRLGALVVQTEWGVLRIGTGFTASARDFLWANKEQYIGETVTFKYQREGTQDLPRFPVFLRFRQPE